MDQTVEEKNEIIMKLLHYFITEKNYNPIIIQGVENEIWLEKLDSDDYKIIRIVSNRIINEEQLGYDLRKTKHMVSHIKKKTLSFKMPVLSIFTNLDQKVKESSTRNNVITNVADIKDLEKSEVLMNSFPDISKKVKFKEKGAQLFMKISEDINKKNKEDAVKTKDVFKSQEPTLTKILIAINIIFYFLVFLQGLSMAGLFGINNLTIVYGKEYYRFLTSMFSHASLLHLAVNMYALYILGSQMENYLGRGRYLIVYLFGGFMAALFSIALNEVNVLSVGASGAIFALMGSLLYFGYHYRVYLSNALRGQIIPIIVLNLALGFMLPGIDNFAHIGGLLGGVIATMAIGIKYKTSKIERINGTIIALVLTAFMIFLAINRVV